MKRNNRESPFRFELARVGSYCRDMKRICVGLIALAVCGALEAGAQSAATEERLNKLAGQIEDILVAQETQRRQITELLRELNALRERQDRPGPNFASQDAVNRLADSIREVDRKRIDDYEKIRAELLKLGRTLSAASSGGSSRSSSPPPERQVEERGFEYEVQSGDTLSSIVAAVRKQKNVRVTTDDVLRANPGLKANRLLVGQKIFIPAP